MKTVIILCMLVLISSVTSAEVYKWEDANGMHYTDSPGSVPEKYREKVYAETREQIRNSSPQARVGRPLQDRPVVTLENQAAAYQANLEQQRRVSAAFDQQQARALAASTKKLEDAFQSLARYMIGWLIFGIIIFIVWILTIIDIVRSEFGAPSNKTVWMLLVILLPLLGMILYCIFGPSQKKQSIGYRNKHQEELIARLKPRDPKDRDFTF